METPYHSRWGTLKNPHFSMAVRAKIRLELFVMVTSPYEWIAWDEKPQTNKSYLWLAEDLHPFHSRTIIIKTVIFSCFLKQSISWEWLIVPHLEIETITLNQCTESTDSQILRACYVIGSLNLVYQILL